MDLPTPLADAMIHRAAQLLYLMLPIYAANMAPPFTRYWRGPNPPISLRYLGSHKTVLGFLAGIVVALLVAWLQHLVDWRDALIRGPDWFATGLAAGFGAMAGDSIKSLVKRRLRIAPGQRWIPADQLDFIVGGLLALLPWVRLGAWDIAGILAFSFIGDIAVNQLSYRLGIRDTKW
ncbi:CDP-archaeol synthase [Noviherbaspirillum pedocola]|uniref:CDP-archaeol synthase n=1 Tax=Noviherbaspirillum pedocola TaxID=2801341 RepID=A0A934STG2_9BURK|nr:CDP-archaeol synthase [Noviherbaspirillum pedocola]MBK4735125.1 CDP-archaeol synthase [Noviherbaspirillum pedocola]